MKIFEKTKNLIYSLLKKSERYTQTDMVYLAKGGFWLTLGQIIVTAVSFLLAIVFANLLDPTTYGNYKYVLSLTGILSIFSLIGMRTAITQATAKGFEGSFYSGFREKLKFGVLGSITAIGLAGYYFFRGNYTLPIPLLLIAIFSPLMHASGIYSPFLMGKRLFNVVVKYNIVRQIIFVGAMVTTLFLTKNLFWLIAIYFITNTFLNYFLYLLTKSKFKPNKKEDSQTFSYGKHLSLMALISGIANHLDKILLFTLMGSRQLAIYSFAMLVPSQTISILKIINALALPKLSTKSNEEIKITLMKKFWKLFLLVGIAILIYIFFAPYIYKIFFPQYLASVPYSQVLIFSLIGYSSILFTTSFQAKVKKKELYLLQILPSFVQILFLIFLIPIFGIWGAVTTVVITKIFTLILSLILFRKI